MSEERKNGAEESRSQKLEVASFLREKGIRATPLRRRVLEFLMEKGEPLSHMEILERFAQTKNAPDRVTLYRTLAVFVDSRVIHQVLGTDGTLRFCMHDPFHVGCPGNHPHFLCRVCGRMICLTDQAMPRIEVPEGATVEGKQFLIFGRCPRCREG
ncbi:MAG: transcriptional repressor [Synergistaceae bacterium]|jgi:Fur family ferric uptake transcriptional regulator/Fur family zinc uptake transcriptional regulator|nr:transcriptional repressor [Synergistaceae bacterium]